tara:strand:+ start:644 stop:1075 length:432 start_codon:yes stop_codon:yes gene_type:complete
VKKKYTVPLKEKKDWVNFTKQMESISVKDDDYLKENNKIKKERKLDLHGYSLEDANKIVKKFIIESFNKNYKKLLIVTGKGSRSKSYDNPYISENFSILKNSVPEYIKNDESLNSIISKIMQADRKEGGDGAISILLRDNKKL